MTRSLVLALGIGSAWAGSALALASPIVRAADRGVSPPLWLIPPAPRLVRPDHEPGLQPHRPWKRQSDPVVQMHLPAANVPTPSLTFAGVGDGFTGPQGTFSVAVAPPDTNGDVGTHHYIQTVNTDFAIFNKSGTVLKGPVQINTLFQGFTGGAGWCANSNDGDPVVLYDQAADRWFITQFGFDFSGGTPVGPYYQCVAVSQTGDPMGQWYQYAFGPYTDSSGDALNDYGKFGVWPDAYYATYNIFGSAIAGLAQVCAFDRAQMLQGAAATEQCVQLQSPYFGLLPVDLDGPTAPPAGTPGMFLGFDSDGQHLDLWRFTLDWAQPNNSQLSAPTQIAVSPFTPACRSSCVPQVGTGEALDILGDRMMYRFSYRNFGDHEVLLASHSVDPGNQTSGVRWYELHNPTGGTLGAGTPVVYQQGTYAPDSNWRWMGSLAMDQSQNIALGFSLGGASLNPSINYTGHLVSDPLNTMGQGEGMLQAGGGVQSSIYRWGDYSMMGIDPSDDCTFWYTTEYIPANSSSFNWATRIGSFKFPNCPPISKLVMSGLPASATAGVPVTFSLTAQNASGATVTTFSGSVNLTSSDPQAAFAANVTFTGGVASNVSITFKTAGAQSVTATPPGLPSAAATGTTQVQPGAPGSYLFANLAASVTAGNATTFNIQAADAFGNPTTSYTGHAVLTSTDPRASLPASVPFAAGVANGVSVTLMQVGVQTLTATDATTSSMTGSGTVTVNIGPLSKLTVTGLAPSVTAGIATSFGVSATDLGGNVQTSYSGTAVIRSSDTRATLPANLTLVAGTASGAAITFETSGTQQVIATDQSTASLTGSAPTHVLAAAATAYKITALSPTPKSGSPTTLTITALDQFGNQATGYIGPALMTSSDTKAVLPAQTIFTQGVASGVSVTFNTNGPQTLTASDSLRSGISATASVTVQSNSPFAFCGCGAGTTGSDAAGLAALLAGLRALAQRRRRR